MRKLLFRLGGMAVVAIAAMALAPLASAATVTIGHAGSTAATPCGAGALVFNLATHSGPSYAVPNGQWTVTSWSTDGDTGGSAQLVLLSDNGNGTYTVQKTSAVETLTPGTINTFSTSLYASGGEILGLWGQGGNCATQTGDAGDVYAGNFLQATAPSPGDVITPTLGHGTGYIMDISATLETFVAPTPTPAVDVCNNVPGNQATIPDGWLPDGQGGCFEPNWVMVCTTSAHVRAGDGSMGTFFQILDSQWAAGKSDPSSIFYQAHPAIYVQGYGTMCNVSDVFTYGGDPSKFKDAGYPVNEAGQPTPQGVSPADWGSIYEYYVPTQ